jgi:hypothetical protein
MNAQARALLYLVIAMVAAAAGLITFVPATGGVVLAATLIGIALLSAVGGELASRQSRAQEPRPR